MITTPKLDAVFADEVYDLLVEHAGASNEITQRARFVIAQSKGCEEYRFGGRLGFGGKFHYHPLAIECPIYVNCYHEDLNQTTAQVIYRTNNALTRLWAKRKGS